ncbi:hypothetical protein ACIBCN_43770 [Nocardia sp. NPDC051052]|uniref:hypothetical protein n=1 Tax=Nocardia sp. NPDC051052 TaxID=3364322 RepID=UPI0037AFA4C2
MSMHQGCDGGVLSLQNAAALVSNSAKDELAIVTAADRFVEPGIDRWNNSPTFALGDAGAAVVLNNSAGCPGYKLKVESICTRTAPVFEVLNRGTSNFSDYPLANGAPSREGADGAEEVIESVGGFDFMVKTGQSKIREVFQQALEEAGIDDADKQLDLIMLPRIGAGVLENSYMPIVEHLTSVKMTSGHARTGHLGCVDPLADLAEIFGGRLVNDGRYAALFGLGGWFTWTCAIVRGVSE